MGEHPTTERPRTTSPNDAEARSKRRGRGRTPAAGLVALLLLAGVLGVSAASLAPAAASAPGAAHLGPALVLPHNGTNAPKASWAWGAAENLSASATYVGAYNASQTLTGGNLTSAGAYVAVQESFGVAYAVYAIVNVTTPSSGHLFVTVQAVEYQGIALAIAATGTFPVAGSYPPNATPALVPMNVSLVASVQKLSAYLSYLNLTTGANGSLSLDNEHVEAFQGVNVSLVAINFPNVTRNASGNTDIRYTTGDLSVQAYVAASFSANFTPALPLVVGPLHVGKNWTAHSTASVSGWEVYAEKVAAVSGGATAGFSKSGGASANATVPIVLAFTVVGTKTVHLPDGSTEVDYVISYEDATGHGGVVIANGLTVLLAGAATVPNGLSPAVSEHPAKAALASTAPTSGRILYSPGHAMVDGQETPLSRGGTVSATPITPSQARGGMDRLGAPVAPVPGTSAGKGAGAWTVVLLAGAVVVGGVILREARKRRTPPT